MRRVRSARPRSMSTSGRTRAVASTPASSAWARPWLASSADGQPTAASRCWSWRTPRARVAAWASRSRSWAPSSTPPNDRVPIGRDWASASTLRTCGVPATASMSLPASTSCWMRVDARLGPGGLAMIHLNDSRVRRGSRLDRHEHIGGGAIGEAGLGHLVRHPRLAAVPVILETPGMGIGLGCREHVPGPAPARGWRARCVAPGSVPGARRPDVRPPGAVHRSAPGWCARAHRPVPTLPHR